MSNLIVYCTYRFNKTIQVLLLPINTGGNGLNLTEATHVILVEPCMNAGLEVSTSRLPFIFVLKCHDLYRVKQ